jgi:hypothetical protein
MSNNNKKGPGGHYSGKNPVPNIQRFVESLDADKKSRDAKINEQMKAKETKGGDVKDHQQEAQGGVPGSRKTVTDPTTGKEVQIEDVNADFMKAVDNPQVSTR